MAPGTDSDGSYTIGELKRLVQDAIGRLGVITNSLEQNFVRKDVFDLVVKDLRDDVESLKSDKVWLQRAIGLLVLAMIFGAALAAGGGKG